MRPDQAAAVLGVAVDADDDTVRAAFRDRAREAHPDRSGDETVDLSILTAARDVLLGDAGTPPVSQVRRPPTQPRTARPATSPATGDGAVGRAVYGLMAVAGALLVVGAIVLVVVALASGGGGDPEVRVDECLVVTDDGVAESDCSAPRALRIVGEFSGARTCPSGSDSLVVGSTTWCLEPAE